MLAHRALEVFSNSETRLTEPAWRFQLDDPRLFAPAAEFAAADLAHRDSTAWHWQAVQLYQRLTQLHLTDARPDALSALTLERLAFARQHGTLPDKDSLYVQALDTLAATLPMGEARSAVRLARAQWHAEQAHQYQRLAPDSAWKREKKSAAGICRAIIAQPGQPFATKKAEALLAQLTLPTLEVQVEEAVMPELPFKIALTYANLGRVWLRVVQDDDRATGQGRYRDQEALKRILQMRPLRAWDVELPEDGDLNAHLTELPVEGLPLGGFHLIASSAPDFGDSALVVIASVQATRLAAAQRQGPDGRPGLLVMDRLSGAPIAGAKAELFAQVYQQRDWREQLLGTATTDADGMAEVPVGTDARGQQRWAISHGKDRLSAPGSYYWHRGEDDGADSLRTFLFTDRAIYRPGQPVLFKGIVTVKRGAGSAVKAGHATTVHFLDVNRQPIDSLAVTTDAFGAFRGEFKAPEGRLTGGMMLEEEHGSRSIRVEEYKRPTFEVLFPERDTATARSAAKLNGMATVQGLATSYAGVPLDGAQVQWKVMRAARMPWWAGGYWRSFMPWGRPAEVASGTAATDGAGRFSITFLAQADPAFPVQADPTFTFTVEASITDVNGETQSGSTRLSVGYRRIDIALPVGEGIDRSATDSLHLAVQDLDGHALDVPMDVRITRLRAPATPLRDRLWERPDVHVLTREAHQALFPEDVHADERDPLTWAPAAVVLERRGWRADGGALALDGIAGWDVGSYLIEVSARDADGAEVQVRKHVAVYDPGVQHTGFVQETFHVEPVKARAEPGEKAQLLVSSALPEARLLMEVEREGKIAVRRWFTVKDGQQLVELPVLEADRGGFSVHFISVERGRAHREEVAIDVPWSNKELQVEWMTFRDNMLPGSQEEWRLKITGPEGEKVAAQLLAGMYDASLDHFVPHAWDLSVWPSRSARWGWAQVVPFGTRAGESIWRDAKLPRDTVRPYPTLRTFGLGGSRDHFRFADGMMAGMADNDLTINSLMAPPAMAESAKQDDGMPVINLEEPTAATPAAQPVIRTDFRETAFFFPDLLTDKDGSVVLKFTMPDALTRWKLMGLAHTTDLKTAAFTKEVITQKPLMVTPNLPRFLREGDRITLTAKVAMLAAPPAGAGGGAGPSGAEDGTASLELFDPFTNASLNARFGLESNRVPFSAGPGASAAVAWAVRVPEGVSTVGVRISAKAGAFTDAEERPLPVLTDRVLVTESLPLPISQAGTKTFTLEKLKNNTSTTLRHHRLKLEFTPNPAWYAVQALPYLMEYPHQCSEQVFSRFYANSLAAHIVDERPKIKEVFAQWAAKGPGNEDAFLSKLEKNSELKNTVLAETPWVLNARNETESKQRIALLFDMQRMASEQRKALGQLRDAQLGNGAWPWFSGMGPSRWATQVITAGMGQLERLGAADLRPDGQAQVMLKRAVDWLDGQVEAEHKRLLKETTAEQREQYIPGPSTVQYLYARSFFPRWPITGATRTAVEFHKGRLASAWTGHSLQEQAMIALALHRLGDEATAQLIMRSLGERATRSEELGMYWKHFRPGYAWWDFPTETHALLIAAFHEVAGDEQAVHALRLHLLKLKQTTDWRTTRATAEACHALLLTGDDWLEPAAMPAISVGGKAVQASKQEAGTGYFTQAWAPQAITPAMGEVSVTTTADRAAWGALYWQYFERMDKVTAAESPLRIRKQVLLNEPGEAGPRLVALDQARALKPGDKLTVRIELRTDRAMDFVHLKDLRASGMEPLETLSGHRFQGGLGYYQSTRDAATDIFIDHLRPGTYVLEYHLRVAHAGDFSNGITTAMCMYAPEFAAHSEGVRIMAED